jgi:thiol-disulfide isomerase/thioredoxin
VDFGSYPVVIVAWSQKDCPHCEEYIPTFRKVAQKYASCVPSAHIDANEYSDLADGYWVRGTPMTMILRYGRRSPYVLDGVATEEQVEAMYQTVMRGFAMHGQECEI